MLNLWTRPAQALALLATGLVTLLVSPIVAKDPLPTGTASKLIAADIEFLQKGFEKTPTAKGFITGLKSAAMLLALNAQNNLDGPDGAKMAAIRDTALKIAGALEAGKVADAKKAVETLATASGGDPKKTIKLAEQHNFSLDEAMKVLGPAISGGMNIENDLKPKDVDKTIKDLKKVELYGARIALVGQYSLDLPSNEAVGEKKKKWDEWSKEMTTLGMAMAEAAKADKPDLVGLKKKIATLNKNCADCHNVFRK